MTRTLKRVAPMQLGKILGVLYACMGLIFLPFFGLIGAVGAFAQSSQQQAGAGALTGGLMLVLGLLMPVMYGVMGFIGGVICAALYNLIARWVGGIEVEVE